MRGGEGVVCVYVCMCTYFTAEGADPLALGDGPQLRVLAVGVALIITLVTKQHLRRERRGGEREKEREKGEGETL